MCRKTKSNKKWLENLNNEIIYRKRRDKYYILKFSKIPFLYLLTYIPTSNRVCLFITTPFSA